jgi:hexosaminidase
MSPINIIPKPIQYVQCEGYFLLSPETTIVAAGDARKTGLQLASLLAPATGFWLNVQPSASAGSDLIDVRLDARMKRLGTEGYRLSVSPERVDVRAYQEPGLFYAIQSLRQLLPVDVYRSAPVGTREWKIPCVEIEDTPRFGWRGAHLDVARHFMPKSFIKKFVDLLATHKLNTFHWHLTDDQGWRIEIERYPRLTEVGAWRKETLVGHHRDSVENLVCDGKPHGGFYTQEDVREIVAYARERFVNVVPEIEMPGHAQAAIAAYRELGNTGRPGEVRTFWGISDDVFNANESTIAFLQNVLEEVLTLFPSQFIHVGGDECPKKQWKESPEAQARMRELGLANEEELQSYFIRRMDQFLTQRDRRLVGWDEILEGGLAPNATVMSWRGEEGGIAAAKAGHDVVMAPNHSTYLDYYQSEDRESEPLAIGGYVPLEKVYHYEPVPAPLGPEEARHVLGAQGQLWTEYMPDYRQVEYMAFPRLSALAEVVWTPAERKDYQEFLSRLAVHLKRLDALDVNYRKLSGTAT